MLQLKPLVDEISKKLGQYVFTEMYDLDSIVWEINDCIDDVWLHQIVWDFSFSKYDNINWTVFLTQKDATASSYTMPRQIWFVINAWAIENNRKIPLEHRKYGDFDNRNNPTTNAYQYFRSWNTIYLSEAHDVIVELSMSPVHCTSADYYTWWTLILPDDFKWFMKDRVLANMMPIYLSDGQVLADKYFEKSEIRLKKLADKYWRAMSDHQVTVASPWKTPSNTRARINPYTEETRY